MFSFNRILQGKAIQFLSNDHRINLVIGIGLQIHYLLSVLEKHYSRMINLMCHGVERFSPTNKSCLKELALEGKYVRFYGIVKAS